MAWGRSNFELTYPEVDKLYASKLAVIPTGSVEQHGPHLPMGTDAMAGIAFGKAVAEKLGAVLVPFPVIGVTPYHMHWKGCLTFSQTTYVNVFKDVCKCLYKHGIRSVLVSNGHEGNIAPLRFASDELQQELEGLRIVVANTWFVVCKLFPDLEATHAAEMEALEAMCYDPSLVHLDRAANPSPIEAGRAGHDRFRRTDIGTMLVDFREVAVTGWYGSLERAKPERVPEILEKTSKYIADEAMAMFKAVREAY
jgi:creatinine amidohydrolase